MEFSHRTFSPVRRSITDRVNHFFSTDSKLFFHFSQIHYLHNASSFDIHRAKTVANFGTSFGFTDTDRAIWEYDSSARVDLNRLVLPELSTTPDS